MPVIALQHLMNAPRWPKVLPALTPEQQQISDDFMRYWHEILPENFPVIENFNHGYPVKHAPVGFRTTLEIGAGLGEHLAYEKLSEEQGRNYIALELRENMAEKIRRRFPDFQVRVGDCQTRLGFPDGHFDRILAIHILEHLPNLPAAIRETHRLCKPGLGVLSVVIPCEGGLAYALARQVSARRIFEKRYKQSYDWFVRREHVNLPREIIAELSLYFKIVHRSYFPFVVPLTTLNLCIGLTLKPRQVQIRPRPEYSLLQ
jgi:SAM-dependent methyltransferase